MSYSKGPTQSPMHEILKEVFVEFVPKCAKGVRSCATITRNITFKNETPDPETRSPRHIVYHCNNIHIFSLCCVALGQAMVPVLSWAPINLKLSGISVHTDLERASMKAKTEVTL